MLGPEANCPRERLILAQSRIVRTRHWHGRGSTLVSAGGVVQASDPIAEVAETSEIHLLDAAAALRLKAAEVRRHLQVEIGAEVADGQLLARRAGLFRGSLSAPAAGTVLHLDDARGILLLRAAPPVTTHAALIRGEVSEVEADESVEITTQGAVIQGIWGNGKAGTGTLRLLVAEPGGSADGSLVNPGLRGTVLVAGASADREVLERAQAVGVAGLVAGSIDGTLIALARRVAYPIVLTEGFGALPINEPSFRLFGALNGREATVGVLSTRVGVPEVLVVKGGVTTPSFLPGPLATGDRVRLMSAPYSGQLGTVEESAGRRVLLPSGVHASSCTVRLDSGLAVPVPYTNLERIIQ